MADNAQPQGIQQPIDKPVREFIQVDTSRNAYMENGYTIKSTGLLIVTVKP